MDSKEKYNKLQEAIDSMTEDERKSLETNIEESLDSHESSIEGYARLVEEHKKRLSQKILEELNKIAKNLNFKKANFIKINK